MTARVQNLVRRLRRCEQGATAIEYAFIAVLISIAGIAGMQALGTSLQNVYNELSGDVDRAAGDGAPDTGAPTN